MTETVRPPGFTPGEIDFSTLFAANIHDIKNLLFLLLGSLDQTIAEAGGEGSQLSPQLSTLKYNGQRINDKLIQLLSLFKINQGRYQTDIEYHSVEEFVEDVAVAVKPLLAARSISIEMAAEDGLCWFFDRNLAEGVVSNAIHNALNHARKQVRLSAFSENGFLAIRVEDDGEGFPPEALETGPVTGVSKHQGGTGLGLYFSTIAAKMHTNRDKTGYIEISNGGTLGGAVFSLYLP